MKNNEENTEEYIKAWAELGISCKEAAYNITKAFANMGEKLSTPVDNSVDNFKGCNPIKKF